MKVIRFLVLVFGLAHASGAVAPPNILFAISDDQSYPHTGANGCDWVKTPAFDRIAEQGLLFRNCYTPNAKCAPSRSTIVTGRYSWQLEEAGNHVCFFPDKFKSWCEVLDESTDYVVGCTGKGVSPVRVTKGRQLTGKRWDRARTKPPAGGMSGNDYAGNFAAFLKAKPEGRPFCFWYGCHEPHRGYEFGAGIRKGGKSVEDIDQVPAYWPDNGTVRTDMLDYAFEIEHFDTHLGRMVRLLEESGELENTIIVVTADNGMPFPRAKGIQYEISNHLPLAVMWPAGIRNPGRVVDDYVSFVDIAPTFLELAGVGDPVAAGMQPISGRSWKPIFDAERAGRVVPERDHVLLGQERHDVGRPGDAGYPVRSIIRDGMLYTHVFEPARWPMGNPETGYLNTDGSPTKSVILALRREGGDKRFWDLCFGKQPAEQFYDLGKDPDCLHNLMSNPEKAEAARRMKEDLFARLKAQGDPRMFGRGEVFDRYPYADVQKDFYRRYTSGELKEWITGWVNKSDFEKEPVEE